MKRVLGEPQKEMLNKILKCNSLVQKNCMFPSKKDIALQKQLGVGSQGTQVVYFIKYTCILFEQCQEAQILRIPLISCLKTYGIIILPEVDQIYKKL